MAKRVDRLREQGRKKSGRPWLRLEECVRRDIHKVGVVGDGWLRTEGRGGVSWSRHGRSVVPSDLTS